MSYGEGSLEQRDGFWYVRLQYRGKRKVRATGETDRRAALREKPRITQEIRDEIDAELAGTERKRTAPTIAHLLELALADALHKELSDYRNIKQRIETHLKPGLGHILLSEWRNTDWYQFVSVKKGKLSDATLNRCLAILRRGWKLGQADQLIDRPLILEALPEDNVRSGILGADDYQRLKEVLEPHARIALVLAYRLGQRRGLILSLKWEHVDFAAGKIRFDVPRRNRKPVPTEVPIYADMQDELLIAYRRRKTEYVVEYQVLGKDGEVKRARGVTQIYKAWRTGARAIGRPDLLFHDLRRTFATAWSAAKLPQSLGMKMTGHQTDRMWKRYNIDGAIEEMRGAAKQLEALEPRPEKRQEGRVM